MCTEGAREHSVEVADRFARVLEVMIPFQTFVFLINPVGALWAPRGTKAMGNRMDWNLVKGSVGDGNEQTVERPLADFSGPVDQKEETELNAEARFNFGTTCSECSGSNDQPKVAKSPPEATAKSHGYAQQQAGSELPQEGPGCLGHSRFRTF
jgi:hypothetical protein